jgi:hypothetical protein
MAGIEYEYGVPVKIESWASTEEKQPWQAVRADNFMPIAGLIISATVASGDVTVTVKNQAGEEQTISHCYKENGIRIVRRSR